MRKLESKPEKRNMFDKTNLIEGDPRAPEIHAPTSLLQFGRDMNQFTRGEEERDENKSVWEDDLDRWRSLPQLPCCKLGDAWISFHVEKKIEMLETERGIHMHNFLAPIWEIRGSLSIRIWRETWKGERREILRERINWERGRHERERDERYLERELTGRDFTTGRRNCGPFSSFCLKLRKNTKGL